MNRVEMGSGNGESAVDTAMEKFDQLVEEITGSPSPQAVKEKEAAVANAPATPAAAVPPVSEEEKEMLRLEAEATAKAEEEQRKTQEAEAAAATAAANVFKLPDELAPLFEGEEYKDPKAFYGDVAEIIRSNDKLVLIMDKHAAVSPFLAAIENAKTPVEVAEIAAKMFAIPEAGIPDKTDDPDGYIEYTLKQKELDAQARKQQEDQQKQAQIAEEANQRRVAIEQQAVELRTQFQKDRKLSDVDMKKFMDFTTRLLAGENGKLPTDLFDRLYEAYTYKDELAKKEEEKRLAAEKALIDGKNAGVEAARAKKVGDGLPDLTPTGKRTEVTTPVAPEMQFLTSMAVTKSRVDA